MEYIHLKDSWVLDISEALSLGIRSGALNEHWTGDTINVENSKEGPVYEPNWIFLGGGLYGVPSDTAKMLVNALDICAYDTELSQHYWDQDSSTVWYMEGGTKKIMSLQRYLEYMLPFRINIGKDKENA